MTAVVDVYWSFRSPYSYLATPDMGRLRDDYDVQTNLRCVLPLAVRSPSPRTSGTRASSAPPV